MKILFVSVTEYAVEHFAGPYIAALHKAGHDLHVLTGSEIGDYTGPEGIIRESIGLGRKPDPFKDLSELISLTRYIRKHKFDVVYSICPKAGLVVQLAAKIAGVKHRVHFVTGQVWKTRTGLSRWGLKFLDWVMCSLVTKAYVDSRSQANFLIQQKVLKADKAVVLASGSVSGVVIEDFPFSEQKRREVRQQYNIADDEVLIFFLGRISVVKGIRDLVKAVAIARQSNDKIRLLIVGPDEGDLENIQQVIREKNLTEAVVGQWSSTPRPAKQYSAAEMLCVPSYMEGFGNVVMEAACAGVPAVGSDIYGLQDSIVDGETGLRYPLGDVQALADCLSKLANDHEFRKRLGENAFARMQTEFDQPILVDAFMAAHRQMTGE